MRILLLGLITAFSLVWHTVSAETVRLRGFTVPNNPAVLKDAPAFGANAVRVMLSATPEIQPDGKTHFDLSKLETVLDEAKKNNIAVIVDLHGVKNPAHQNYRKDRNGRSADFWNDDSNLELMKQFWTQLATACKDREQTIWYDLYNEPLDWNDFPSYPAKWPKWAQELIDLIRTIDNRHEIVIEPGPGGLCWGFRTFPALKGDRLIYSVHNYQPHAYTHQGISSLKDTDLAKAYLETVPSWPAVYSDAGGGLWDKERLKQELAPALNFQKKHNARIYVGEFGVIRWAPNADRYLRDNIELFEEYGWDWTYHSFREYDGWSFEYEPAFGKAVKAKTETATAGVLKEFLARNKEPGQFGERIVLKESPDDFEQNEYSDAGIGIRCDLVSKAEMEPNDSATQGKIVYRPWGEKDGSEKRYLYFDQKLNPGYGWQEFSFRFTPKSDGEVTLMFSGIWHTDPKTGKRVDTWTCYDNIRVAGAQIPDNGSLELLDENGKAKFWDLNSAKGVKLIESEKLAADGCRYVMAALNRCASIRIKVSAGKQVTVTGMAKRAGRFERNFSVGESKLSFVKAETEKSSTKKSDEYVILFKGNSITRHGVKASLGWDHVSGMAAGSEEKDYAHLLAAMIQNVRKDKKVRIVFGSQDSASAAADALCEPDLVVIQTGEHSQTNQEKVDEFPAIYAKTLDAVLNTPSHPQVIAVGVWTTWPPRGDGYAGYPKMIQDIQRKLSAERNIPFVSVEKLGLDPACSGSGTDGGVKWHPNDKGHQGYAESIFAVWQKQEQEKLPR